jgi:DNA-binding NarL/FixJ family response regulator
MRLLVCDDQDMFLEALVDALVSRGHTVVAMTADPFEVPGLVGQHLPDLVLLDVRMPGSTGVDVARELRRRRKDTPVVLLTASREAWVREAFDTGLVDGLVSKESGIQTLDTALRRVLAGERTMAGCHQAAMQPIRRATPLDLLTGREREVLTLMAGGSSTRAMATSLGVSDNTVRTHVRSVLHKLGVHHRTRAAHAAYELGLVS